MTIGTIAAVVTSEGLGSALRRANERAGEAAHNAVLRWRGLFVRSAGAPIVNASLASVSARLGGVAIQLTARLHAERALRSIALLHPGGLELSAPHSHMRRIAGSDLGTRVRDAMSMTGAKSVHIEGTSGGPLGDVLQLIDSGIPVVISVHDFSLFCARPHLLEQPMDRFCFYSRDLDRCERCLRQTWDVRKNEQAERRGLARLLLMSAAGVIFPSQFLLDRHRELFALPRLEMQVVEPAGPAAIRSVQANATRRGIAYAGSVKRHKGAQLLPEVAAMLAARGLDLHVFGGGDVDLFRMLRQLPNVVIHGYYRSDALPSLLARHSIGLVVIPSIVPEAYCLTLSEAWLGGASVAAFDLGAQADRIRRDGGGWLAPLESGAAGLVEIVDRWLSETPTAQLPRSATSPADAARSHVELYRKWGLL
jgi:glycosyltransferase involved in cell wall biosynthesis